jgi:site-specific DNA-methyltransferase (adenine-specific)
MRLLLGDCLDKLKELDDNSVDSIVTDPPYGLAIMGKKWDYDVPSQEIWEECMRVLKPGGHLLAFAGSRTYHRMAIRIEDAGFEIRDQLMWIYGSGFPKSMNVGMKVDEKLGNKRELVERPKSEQRPNADNSRDKNKDIGGFAMSDNKYKSVGNSEWEGWGTALKPSHEPIVMARKPLIGTVVDNVLEWGTGGINIDESRIQHDEPVKTTTRTEKGDTWNEKNSGLRNNPSNMASADPKGRFPANIIFDEEAGKILDEQSGQTTSGKVKESKDSYDGESNTGFLRGKSNSSNQHGDKGGASRFFYCPKTSKTDRNEGLEHIEKKQNIFNGKSDKPSKDMKGVEKKFTTQPKSNFHPTVKPTDLMAYLVRMVTPKGGTVLDPFMGSGSTGKAAVRGGFDFVGIEREEEYMKIAKTRIQYEEDNPYNEETKTRVHINENANKFW